METISKDWDDGNTKVASWASMLGDWNHVSNIDTSNINNNDNNFVIKIDEDTAEDLYKYDGNFSLEEEIRQEEYREYDTAMDRTEELQYILVSLLFYGDKEATNKELGSVMAEIVHLTQTNRFNYQLTLDKLKYLLNVKYDMRGLPVEKSRVKKSNKVMAWFRLHLK